MDRPTDNGPLEAALRELAARQLPGLLEEAAGEARDEVKRILRERMVALLLEDIEAAPPARGVPQATSSGSGPGGRDRAEPPDAAGSDDRQSLHRVIEALQDGAEPDPVGEEIAPGTTGLYVYGIVPHDASVPGDVPGGVAGNSPVRLLPADGVQAVVSDVPLSEFAHQALRTKADDPAWLEAAVRAHEGVLARFHEDGVILPLRFGTVFADVDRATEALAARGDQFRADLLRLDGCSEWGLDVASDWDAVVGWVSRHDDELEGLQAQAESAPEGRSFFLRRRLARALADEAAGLQADVAAEVHRRVAEVAEDSIAPEATRAGDGPEAVVSRAAYLVDGQRVDELRRAVDELRAAHGQAGFTLRLTGPWAPYSFVAIHRASGSG